MSKLLVAGSRGITDDDLVRHSIREALTQWGVKPTTLIHGGATGVDTLAGRWATDLELEVLIFPARWEKYGKAAGYRRNLEMVDACDYGLVIWDGQSKGSTHTMNLLERSGKPWKVVEWTVKTPPIDPNR